MSDPKQLISFRIPADELAFYRNLVEEDNLSSLTQLIVNALRRTYKPPIAHLWVCRNCGKPRPDDPINDCSGVFAEDMIDED